MEQIIEADVEAKDNIIEYIELLESKIKDDSSNRIYFNNLENEKIDMKQELKAKFGDSVLNMGELKFRQDCPEDFRDDMIRGLKDKTKEFQVNFKFTAVKTLDALQEIYLYFLYFEDQKDFAKLLLIIKSLLISNLYLFPGYSDVYEEIKLYLNYMIYMLLLITNPNIQVLRKP